MSLTKNYKLINKIKFYKKNYFTPKLATKQLNYHLGKNQFWAYLQLTSFLQLNPTL